MQERFPILLPLAIILAGAILGVTLYVIRTDKAVPFQSGGDLSLLRPVSLQDRTAGNPDAQVTVVTYSDIDCAYCKTFQETMEQIVADYATEGSVLWVYRHFPIIESHPDAALHAEAAECAGAQGGNQAFFSFIDALHQEAPDEHTFNPEGYSRIIDNLGLDAKVFADCTAGSTFEQKVSADFDNGVAIGVNGTPYSLILIKGHSAIPVSGALPYITMKEVIARALAQAATPPTAP